MEDLQSILFTIRDLEVSISELRKLIVERPQALYDYRSEIIGELAEALASAQGEMESAIPESQGNYGKYADIDALVNSARPHLSKYGLSVVQPILMNKDSSMYIKTILMHKKTGQYISSDIRLVPPSADAQKVGSYITYMRKYAFASLVGVVKGQPDDDGQEATNMYHQNRAKKPRQNIADIPRSIETVSESQLEELNYELEGFPEICEDVLEALDINCLADMPASVYRSSITKIRELKLEAKSIKS